MLKGLGNLGNIGNILKQAQQMGSRMQEVNDQLKGVRVTGASGGGMIEVEANGLGELLRVTIDPDLISRGDREMIEDLIPAAVNQAHAKAREAHTAAMQEITGGMNLPGLDDAMASFTGDGLPPSPPSP